MASNRKWTEEENCTLVQLYRQAECLWNINSRDYRKKDMRSTAIQNICDGMNIDGLTGNDVKNKIKSIRSTYYLEMDKIKNTSRSGAGANVYVPKVKWFTELHEFIKDVAIKRKTMGNYTSENSNTNQSLDAATAKSSLEGPTADNELPAPPQNDLESAELPPPPIVHAPRSKRSKLSQMASIVADIKEVNSSLNEKDDDFDIFGMSVAAQMRKLSEEQAIIAQDEIQSVLTRCRLIDIRSRNTDFNTASFPNTQFSSSQPQFVQLTQLPQTSPAGTSSTISTNLGFHRNSDMSQAETEEMVINTDDYSNIISEAFGNA